MIPKRFIIFIAVEAFLLTMILVPMAFAAVDSNGNIVFEEEKPELKCLSYSDGRLTVVNTDYGDCPGWEETVSWFLSKGFKIDATGPWFESTRFVVIMSR